MSLTLSYAVLTAIAFAGLGVGLSHALSGVVRERALVQVRDTATLSAELLVKSTIRPDDLGDAISPSQRQRLDRTLGSASAREQIARVKVFNPDGLVIYSDDHSLMGNRYQLSPAVLRALRGDATADLASEAHASANGPGRLLEAYVPLRFETGEAPAGVVEVYIPYEPIAEAIADDRRLLLTALVLGLGVLYLLQFPIARKVSGALRREVAHNQHQAFHDALTGLPNRTSLFARIEELTAATRCKGLAVVLLDLDGFKEVNDTLGHHTGDVVLAEVGQRLRESARRQDAVARLGGDEFAVVLVDVEGPAEAAALVDDLLRACDRSITVDEIALTLTASAGIALHPEHGTEAAELLQRADVAMYQAKEGKNRALVYSPARDPHTPDRLALLGDLRAALAGDELFLEFQPKADLRTGRVCGVEALVRWNHPEQGRLAPDAFVPLAERAGLLAPLTAHVLEKATATCRRWCDRGLELGVAVNVGAADILDATFPDVVASILTATGLRPSLLTLEITETSIIGDPAEAARSARRLAELGVRVSIDDFGAGYSSLRHLQRLSVDELKIDRSFVSEMLANPSDLTIVRSIIELGTNLGLEVVAEGVEDLGALEALADLGCEYAQGFHLARPLPAAEVEDWVREHPQVDTARRARA